MKPMLQGFNVVASKHQEIHLFSAFHFPLVCRPGDQKEWTHNGYCMLGVKSILFYILRMNPESRKLGSHCSSWNRSSAGTTWASLTSHMSGPHLLVTAEFFQFSSPVPSSLPSRLKIHEAWELQILFNRNVWPVCFCLQITVRRHILVDTSSAFYCGNWYRSQPLWDVALNTVQNRTHSMLEGGKLASLQLENKNSSPPAHPFPAAGMLFHPH